MDNPWCEIALSDYEDHMSLASVGQLQVLNAVMKTQLELHPVASVIILGLAGGNGLEHVDTGKYRRVWGVDVNQAYLAEAEKRFPQLAGTLECLCLDLRSQAAGLPQAELVIANLLIEYIGCDAFVQVLAAAAPRFVSCLIQIDAGAGFVSESPYLHAFDRLDEIHCQMDEGELARALAAAGYRPVDRAEHPLPNGKKLLRLDYRAVGN